jgi:hypothetical protein
LESAVAPWVRTVAITVAAGKIAGTLARAWPSLARGAFCGEAYASRLTLIRQQSRAMP